MLGSVYFNNTCTSSKCTNAEVQITWAAESNFTSAALSGAWIVLIKPGDNSVFEIMENFSTGGGGGVSRRGQKRGGEGRRKEEDQGKRKGGDTLKLFNQTSLGKVGCVCLPISQADGKAPIK